MAARITVGELEAILAIRDRVTPAVPAMVNAVNRVEDAVGKLPPKFDQWTAAQQRAAQKMERLHEEALKMNTGFKASDDRAELLSQTLGKVTSTASASAAALGLPIGPLNGLNSAIDVVGLGFNNLTKSAVGFNVASVAVVGAGLAVGSMIGGLIRDLPGAADAYDSLAAAALNYFGLLEKNTGPTSTNLAAMGAIQAQVQKNVVALMRSQGKDTEQIIDQLTGKVKTGTDNLVDSLRKQDSAATKAAAAAKKMGEEQARAAERAREAYAAAAEKAREAWDKFYDTLRDRSFETTLAMKNDIAEAAQKIMEARTKQLQTEIEIAEQIDAQEAERMARIDQRTDEQTQEFIEDQEEKRQALIDAFDDAGNAVDNFGDILEALGHTSDSVLVKMTRGFSDLAHGIGDIIAAPTLLGKISAGLSLVGKLFGSIFGGQREHMKVNDMRDAFVEAAGGLDKLRQRAHEAGLTLDRLLQAKKVKDYEAAVAELEEAWKKADQAAQDALDLHSEALEKTKAAAEEYGFTIDEMGPKWAAQQMDEKAASLWEKYQLLTAAGFDHDAIIRRMGEDFNELVNQYRAGGIAMPEAMREVIEEMIRNRQLLDENGVAFESLEDAGITWATTMSEMFTGLMKKIEQLVNALLGIPDRDVSVNLNVNDPDDILGSGGKVKGGGKNGGKDKGGYAAGYHGIVTQPRLMLVGERGPERVDISPPGSARTPEGGGWSGPPHIEVIIGGDRILPTLVRYKKAGWL